MIAQPRPQFGNRYRLRFQLLPGYRLAIEQMQEQVLAACDRAASA